MHNNLATQRDIIYVLGGEQCAPIYPISPLFEAFIHFLIINSKSYFNKYLSPILKSSIF